MAVGPAPLQGAVLISHGQSEGPELLNSRHAVRTLRRLRRYASARLRSLGPEAKVQPLALDAEQFDIEVVIVANTLLYRHLAVSYVEASDRVVEIGSAHGHCTALFPCPAVGVELASGLVEEAKKLHPNCNFVCGDVLGDDTAFLDREATVLFLDIGGKRNYKPVVKALAVCMMVMPHLRLVVTKSTEARRFLTQSEDAVHTVARDLAVTKDDDAEVAEQLAREVRRRGGEMPLSLVGHLPVSHDRLRFLAGKKRVAAIIRHSAPLMEVVEVASGPPELRQRVRAAPGPLPAPPAGLPAMVTRLEAAVRKLCPAGADRAFMAVFARLRRFGAFVEASSDPELYSQASDPELDPRAPEAWSEAWRSVVAMRHLFVFLRDSPAFVLQGPIAGCAPTVDELSSLRVSQSGRAEVADGAPEVERRVEAPDVTSAPRPRLLLQVLQSGWGEAAGEQSPEVENLMPERAWLLAGTQVLQEFPLQALEAAVDGAGSPSAMAALAATSREDD